MEIVCGKRYFFYNTIDIDRLIFEKIYTIPVRIQRLFDLSVHNRFITINLHLTIVYA